MSYERRGERPMSPTVQVIGLGPTANWPDKVWPAKNYVALAAALLEAMPGCACIAIFGGPGPAERAMRRPRAGRHSGRP